MGIFSERRKSSLPEAYTGVNRLPTLEDMPDKNAVAAAHTIGKLLITNNASQQPKATVSRSSSLVYRPVGKNDSLTSTSSNRRSSSVNIKPKSNSRASSMNSKTPQKLKKQVFHDSEVNNSALDDKPKMITKTIPTPYGLKTIQVPATSTTQSISRTSSLLGNKTYIPKQKLQNRSQNHSFDDLNYRERRSKTKKVQSQPKLRQHSSTSTLLQPPQAPSALQSHGHSHSSAKKRVSFTEDSPDVSIISSSISEMPELEKPSNSEPITTSSPLKQVFNDADIAIDDSVLNEDSGTVIDAKAIKSLEDKSAKNDQVIKEPDTNKPVASESVANEPISNEPTIKIDNATEIEENEKLVKRQNTLKALEQQDSSIDDEDEAVSELANPPSKSSKESAPTPLTKSSDSNHSNQLTPETSADTLMRPEFLKPKVKKAHEQQKPKLLGSPMKPTYALAPSQLSTPPTTASSQSTRARPASVKTNRKTRQSINIPSAHEFEKHDSLSHGQRKNRDGLQRNPSSVNGPRLQPQHIQRPSSSQSRRLTMRDDPHLGNGNLKGASINGRPRPKSELSSRATGIGINHNSGFNSKVQGNKMSQHHVEHDNSSSERTSFERIGRPVESNFAFRKVSLRDSPQSPQSYAGESSPVDSLRKSFGTFKSRFDDSDDEDERPAVADTRKLKLSMRGSKLSKVDESDTHHHVRDDSIGSGTKFGFARHHKDNVPKQNKSALPAIEPTKFTNNEEPDILRTPQTSMNSDDLFNAHLAESKKHFLNKPFDARKEKSEKKRFKFFKKIFKS